MELTDTNTSSEQTLDDEEPEEVDTDEEENTDDKESEEDLTIVNPPKRAKTGNTYNPPLRRTGEIINNFQLWCSSNTFRNEHRVAFGG